MSTICLFPPERSHMVSPPELAQLVVAAGPWLADGVGSESFPQAASASIATNATRTGHLTRVLIPRTSMSSSTGSNRTMQSLHADLGHSIEYWPEHTIA
jgi:hypothetical protein